MTDATAYGWARPPVQESLTRRVLLIAGVGYGLILGFSFALFAWGYDAWQLASIGANLAWVKLAFGLPLVVAIGGLVGGLAASSSSVVSVALWVGVGWLFGVVAGHMPFDGGNLAIWLADRRLWGEVIFSYGESAAVRTTLMAFLCAVVGAAVGFFENQAVGWAWDRATPEGRMGLGSWGVLLVCVPLALLMALIVNGFINQPLRTPQRIVGELVGMTLAGEAKKSEAFEIGSRSIAPYLDKLTEQYVVHFVMFGSETGIWYSAYVDVAFEDGFVLRCATSGQVVIYCDDFSQRMAGWVDDLVHAGLYGDRPWLEDQVKRLAVDDTVVAWLEAYKDRLSENYDFRWDGQQTGWIFMSIRFDTGFEISCRFRDASPVVVDQCVELSSSSP